MAKVNVEIGATTRGFKRGLQEVEAGTEKLRKSIAGKFSGAGVARSFVAAFGLSLEGIAEKITTPWRLAAEHAKEILDLTERTTKLFEQRMERRRTDQQNLDVERRALEAMNRREGSLSSEKSLLEAKGMMVGAPGMVMSVANISRIREIEKELAQLNVDREESLAKQETLAKKIAAAKEAERKASKAEVDEVLGMREERRLRNLPLEDLKGELERKLAEVVNQPTGFAQKMAEVLMKEIEDVNKRIADHAAKSAKELDARLDQFFERVDPFRELDEMSRTTNISRERGVQQARVNEITRIGGGRAFGAGNAADTLVSENRKHTALLTSIDRKVGTPTAVPKFTT